MMDDAGLRRGEVGASGHAAGRLRRRWAPLRAAYDRLLRPRRTRRIGALLAPLLPASGTVLDVGCGDGHLTAHLQALRPDLRLAGVDVLGRSRDGIEIHTYDGARLPFADRSFDVALLCAVLHHVDEPAALLAEAARVARQGVVLLDHQVDRAAQRLLLRIVDWPGNVPFGVYTPYHFLDRAQWLALFEGLGLRVEGFDDRIALFGDGPLERVFGGRLHFTCRLMGPGT